MKATTIRWACLIPVCALALASGCNALPKTSNSSDTSADSDRHDPCSLLEPKEVEAVLGAPLATPPFRSGGGPQMASTGGHACVYQTADFHYISLEIDFTGGAQSYSMVSFSKKLVNSSPDQRMAKNIKGSFKLDDGTELSGEWDEASLTAMNCCIFNALRGDQMITIDFTGSRISLPQAATLIDAAFKRIDKPLAIDGAANVAAAKTFAGRRPKPVDVCTLLTRAEVEAVVGGPLLADPVPAKDPKSSCTYARETNGMRFPFDVNVIWNGGDYRYRSDGHVQRIGTGMMTAMAADAVKDMGKSDAEAQRVGAAAGAVVAPQAAPADQAWEEAEVRGRQFVAIKKDVVVKIDMWGLKQDEAQKLMAIVLKKI
jgi:hypothetical protein